MKLKELSETGNPHISAYLAEVLRRVTPHLSPPTWPGSAELPPARFTVTLDYTPLSKDAAKSGSASATILT